MLTSENKPAEARGIIFVLLYVTFWGLITVLPTDSGSSWLILAVQVDADYGG